MEGKGQLFLTVKFYLINVEGVREIQNHHEANKTIIVISDEIHQWMLTLMGESLKRNRVFAYL